MSDYIVILGPANSCDKVSVKHFNYDTRSESIELIFISYYNGNEEKHNVRKYFSVLKFLLGYQIIFSLSRKDNIRVDFSFDIGNEARKKTLDYLTSNQKAINDIRIINKHINHFKKPYQNITEKHINYLQNLGIHYVTLMYDYITYTFREKFGDIEIDENQMKIEIRDSSKNNNINLLINKSPKSLLNYKKLNIDIDSNITQPEKFYLDFLKILHNSPKINRKMIVWRGLHLMKEIDFGKFFESVLPISTSLVPYVALTFSIRKEPISVLIEIEIPKGMDYFFVNDSIGQIMNLEESEVILEPCILEVKSKKTVTLYNLINSFGDEKSTFSALCYYLTGSNIFYLKRKKIIYIKCVAKKGNLSFIRTVEKDKILTYAIMKKND